MKKLILVRHAKSDWGNELLKDIDRPLNQRGYSDAYFMSDWFLKSKPLPDCVVSSTAARALNTALIFMRTFEALTEKLNLEPDLYECSVDTLLKIASKTPEAAGTVMIFGHNPAITNFCNKMIREFFHR
jgi:phosphohistidine phosphatase